MRTILILLLFGLTACSAEEPATQSVSGTTVLVEADIVVSITIPPGLDKDLEVLSAEGLKPGVNNRVEAKITFRNNSNSDHRLLVVGEWQDNAAWFITC